MSMFSIYKKLETELDLDGKIYPIDMSFDNVLKFFDIMEDRISFDEDKVVAGLYQLLGVHLDLELEELHEVLNYIMDYLINEGRKEEVVMDLEGNPMPVKKQAPTQDIRHDAKFIFTSFMQAYGINLIKEHGKLDWREFKALLLGLPGDTIMARVFDIRRRPYPKGKYAAEDRRLLKEAKRMCALPGVEVE